MEEFIMKMYIDIEKTFGKLIYLGVKDWKDFNNKNEIKGVKITCVSTATYEKIEIRMKDITKDDFKNIKSKSEFPELEEMIANYWQFNGKSGITLTAKFKG